MNGYRQRLNPALAELSAYAAAGGEFRVRLDANEAPDILSLRARERIADSLSGIDWRRYPDGESRELRASLANHCGVSPEHILTGVGSDELISMLFTTFCPASHAGPTALTLTPTFVMYRITGKVHGHRILEVPLDDAWDMDLNGVLKAMEYSTPSLIFIASPNNPTGTMVSQDRLLSLIEHAQDSLVVIDEAYVDYASYSHLELYLKYDNVMLLRTLSKVGFAALRLGWLIARPAIVQEVNKVRQPYNAATVSQVVGRLIVSELAEEIAHVRAAVIAERTRVIEALNALPGVRATPSQANFIWFTTEKPARVVDEQLRHQGVLVRSFHQRGGRLKQFLRATVGLPHENDEFLHALGGTA